MRDFDMEAFAYANDPDDRVEALVVQITGVGEGLHVEVAHGSDPTHARDELTRSP